MNRFFYGCAITLLVPLMASAADCHSITDRYCVDTFVLAEHGINVSVKTGAKGEHTYKLKNQASEDEDYRSYCPGSKCTCRADVHYLYFTGTHPGITTINAKEKQEADRAQCSVDNASITRRPDFVYTSATLISTAIFNMEYCRTCGGGCHGDTNLATYDAATGHKYVLSDMLIPGELAKLQDDLKIEFITRYVTADRLDYVNSFLAQDIVANVTLDSDVYVEKNVVYLGINSFTLGCAEGSFYPVPIPAKYIQPAFLKRLRTSD